MDIHILPLQPLSGFRACFVTGSKPWALNRYHGNFSLFQHKSAEDFVEAGGNGYTSKGVHIRQGNETFPELGSTFP